ncbi:4-hydroxythreonine-4-phosphate dehydrogenase PdxA [Luteimonas vadosa]|uniref:4-hydroxythreonine-4-phosphate dehydrogenase n=1 Tax=Luteimonas vadosa TaxID=1165507 RepID=A0ABP9E652_9GAMM
MRRPRLALVPGEPAGVGPELCVRALQRRWDAEITVIGDRTVLQQAAARLALPLPLPPCGDDSVAGEGSAAVDGLPIGFIDRPNTVGVDPGSPNPRNASAVVEALLSAAQGCIDGRFDGMVTGPVHKATINAGGIAYTGTTELLAGHAGCEVVMMLANDVARVALATTHLPLREVPGRITPAVLARTLRIVDSALRRDFGIAAPVIAVLGLNPHAGEDGLLGQEELETIGPSLERLRAEGLQLVGPLPADTAFLPRKLEGFDAVLAMYHDQGLPVLKYSGFERAVNLTLGLPYPRVAVDHGTALDIAGTGQADPSSLFAAIETCARLAARGRPRRGEAS